MQQKIYSITCIALVALLVACTPKTGEKATVTTPSKGKAPKISVPTGDVRKNAPKPGEAPSIQIGEAETFQLDNGLKVILVENHKLPQVSFRIFADYQPVLERDAAGYIDMMGDLMSKGTTTRTKAQIDEAVDFIGCSISSDANGASAFGLSKHTEKMLELMSDILLHPTFAQEEFDKSKKKVESGLASQKSDANTIASNVGARLRNGKMHPYGEFTTETTLKNVNLEQVKKHYTTFIKPNISYLVITGDISKAKAQQYAQQYFGKWQKGDVPTSSYSLPKAPEKTVVDFVNKPGAVQSVINIPYPAELTPGTEEVIRARLMNTVLGGYFNSRVNANLREGHGWTYGARTNLRADEIIGSFSANASVRNAVTDSSVIEFLKELNILRNQKVPNSELQVVKNVLTGQFSRNLEEPGTVAEFALTSARFNLPKDYYQTYLTKLNNTTPEQIQQIAQKYIQPNHAHILVVGSRDDVAERLTQFSADGKINFLDVYGEPVKSPNMALPAGMDGKKVIEDYLNAIGGVERIKAISDIQTTINMQTKGMNITVKQIQKGGQKLSMEMLMSGQSMGKTVVNNGKAVQTGAGGPTRQIDGAELDELMEQSLLCRELAYLEGKYQLNLKGIEEINGKNAYMLEVIHPNGSKKTEYYDVKTSLKLREIMISIGADDGQTQVTNDFEEYKAVNGVMFPHVTTTTGIFPIPMKGTVSELKVNEGVSDSLFDL